MPFLDHPTLILAAGGEATLPASDITTLLLAIAVLLGLARLLGELCRKYGQPPVLGEILAGVILGPTILGALNFSGMDLSSLTWLWNGFESYRLPDFGSATYNYLFPHDVAGSAAWIAEEGFITMSAALLLFVVGLEVDLSAVVRQGKAMVLVSAMGILIPFALGFGAATLFTDLLGVGDRALDNLLPFQIFCGLAMSITALPVIAKILMDLNLSKSDMGVLVISSAMCNDLIGWIGFAVVLALMSAGGGGEEAATAGAQLGVAGTIGATLAFLVFMLTLGRLFMHKALPYVQARWSWPGGVISFAFVIAMICAALTEFLGIHSIFGAFIAGVAIGDSHHLRERTRDTIHQFVMNIFAPIFFASIGLTINFVHAFQFHTVAIVCAIALIGKVSGCYLGAKLAKLSTRESMAVGFGMAAQGAVGIILGQLAFQAELISEELMVAIVIMALGTSILAGPAMQRILKLKAKRNLPDLLSERNILIDPEATNIETLLQEMAQCGSEITGLDAQNIYDEVWARERIMHTALPNGLAVPHARLDGLSKPTIVLARSSRGIDFDAADGELARLIILLLTPVDQPDTQIELLSLVAQTFNDADVRSRSIAVKNATELRAILNTALNAEHAPDHHDDFTLGVS